MKLLVPTDFSKLSKIAVKYALGLCQEFEHEMVLLHVISTSTPAMARLNSKKLEEAIKVSSEREMNALLKSIKKEISHDIKVHSKIIYHSSLVKGVESYALKNNIDLICIGTKGATGLKKILIGSNAAGIISNSKLPVLTIPEFARYNGVENIVFSCDLENIKEELNRLVPFAKLMNACIHILHVNTKSGNINPDLLDRENELKTFCSYDKIKTKILDNDSIIDGLNEYVTSLDADMIAMFTRSASLFEKLFDKSITQEAAFQAKTPLLTFQKK